MTDAAAQKGIPTSQHPGASTSSVLQADAEPAPPPSYSQATGHPKPTRQLSLPGDEPSHPSHHVFHPATPSAHPAHAPWPGAHPHQSYQAGQGPWGSHGQHHPQQGDVWTPPPSDEVGKARGRRRFCVALLWAVAIYMLIGMLIGGGIEDGQREGRERHRHSPDRPTITRTWRHLPTAAPGPPPGMAGMDAAGPASE